MELTKKSSNSHRGVTGIETAIVLIAFVIVAAALAFVILNMGFSTTQKAKTVITSTLGEAGSSMEVSGTVVGYSNAGTNLTAVAIPIRITSGGGSVDLAVSSTKISYISGGVYYDDVFDIGCNLGNGPAAPYASVNDAWADAILVCTGVTGNPITGADPGVTAAIVYWTVGNTNTLLEQGEHAIVSLAWNQVAPDERPLELDKLKVEIVAAKGAILSVTRQIPSISNNVVPLG